MFSRRTPDVVQDLAGVPARHDVHVDDGRQRTGRESVPDPGTRQSLLGYECKGSRLLLLVYKVYTIFMCY